MYNALKISNSIGFSRFTIDDINYSLPKNKKIIVLAPHPDDEIIGPGGSLIEASKNLCKVEIIYLTSGKECEKEEREKELKKVCDNLNFSYYIIGGVANKALIGSNKIINILINSRPDIIFIPFFLDDNIDHKKTNTLFYEICSSENKFISHKLEVWSYQVYNPLIVNKVIDISANIKKKEKLIRFYKSQFKSRDWAHYSLGMNAWNSRFLNKREGKGWAECFFVQTLAEYLEFYKEIFE